VYFCLFLFYFYKITPKSKPHSSWETSNKFFVSIQEEVLFFLKDKLSKSELNLNPKLRIIDDPQNLEHPFFKKLKPLRSQTNVAWIDESFKISVAETVVDLRKSADVQRRNSSKSKVSSLKLFKSGYFLNFGSIVPRVRDVQKETQYLLNVSPNWTSQHRSNSNMIKQKNPK
jgi:hypothetical protein